MSFSVPQERTPELIYIPNLDSLRGFAVLLVLWQHLPWGVLGEFEAHIRKMVFPGALGVEVFFILSGFLITRILIKTRQSKTPLRFFYFRRACRILPIYYLTLIVCYFFWPLSSVFYAATFTINIPFHEISDALKGAYTHLWSLSVEEHFYLFWPLLVLSLSTRHLIITAVGLGIVSYALMISTVNSTWGMSDSESFWRTYGVSWNRMYSLLIGSLFAVFQNSLLVTNKLRLIALSLILTWAVFFFLNYPMPLFRGERAVYHLTAALPLATAIFLLAIDSYNRKTAFTAPTGFLSSIGKISYGMYIFHLPVFTFFGIFLAESGFEIFPEVVLALSFTFLISVFSYRYIESPVLTWSKRFSTPTQEKLQCG